MVLFKKTIFTGFMPELTFKDVVLACGFFLPWRWRQISRGQSSKRVEIELGKYLGLTHVAVVDSGRSAIFLALKSLGVGRGDEVIVQAYTCLVVVNAIRFAGAKPVFADIDEEFNMSVEDARKKITTKCKAIIIQHTFGRPARINEILSMAKNAGIQTIEDCAHSLGARYNGGLTGTFADVAIFSFGADKALPAVRGGALATNNPDLAEKIAELCEKLSPVKSLMAIRHLLSYPVFAIGRPLYFFGIGKWWLAFAKHVNLHSRIITKREKMGHAEPGYPSLMPNSLASLLLAKLPYLDSMNERRRSIALYYDKHIHNPVIIKPRQDAQDGCIFLRYTLRLNNPEKLLTLAKRHGIMLGNWYDAPVAPKDCSPDATAYKTGDCPNADRASLESVNLPTVASLTENDLKRIVDLVNSF